MHFAFSGCRYPEHPQKTRPFNIQQGKKLVAGMDVNIDDEIGDDE